MTGPSGRLYHEKEPTPDILILEVKFIITGKETVSFSMRSIYTSKLNSSKILFCFIFGVMFCFVFIIPDYFLLRAKERQL